MRTSSTSCTWTVQFAQSRYLVFAQDPLVFPTVGSSEDPTLCHSVTFIGSAFYLEPTSEQAKMNIFDIADTFNVNHLDYNLDLRRSHCLKTRNRSFSQAPDTESSIKGFIKGPTLHVRSHHCRPCDSSTAMQWREVEAISDLPFVGLPRSCFQGYTIRRSTSTLRVPYIAKKCGL